MTKPRPSMMKRQREQAKREKKALKAERRAQRKLDNAETPEPEEEVQPA